MPQFFVKLGLLACMLVLVHGHGMVLEPPNRGSLWRYDPSLPEFWDDNGQFCGGREVQHNSNGGKCGFCGDSYSDPTPRKFEIGGSFGAGDLIARTYKPGDAMPVKVMITANHLGYFNFTLCNLDKYQKESEECFSDLQLKTTDGKYMYKIDSRLGIFEPVLQLPQAECKHCILQWTYTAGNTWGMCEDGGFLIGCGPQETFRTCSDIAILA